MNWYKTATIPTEFHEELKDKKVTHIDGPLSTANFPPAKNGWSEPKLTGRVAHQGIMDLYEIEWKSLPDQHQVYSDFLTQTHWVRKEYLVLLD